MHFNTYFISNFMNGIKYLGNNLETTFTQNVDKFGEKTLDKFQHSMEDDEETKQNKTVGPLDNPCSNSSGSLVVRSPTWEIVNDKASSYT